MREAFDRARKDHPNSPIVPVIKDVNRVQAEERRFTQLRIQFKEVGLMWFNTQVDKSTRIYYRDNRSPIEQRRKQWTQALAALKDKPSEERIELLKDLASGMQLAGDRPHIVYIHSLLQIESDNPLDFLRNEFLGVNFTPQSMLFIEAISDMSGYSEQQKQEFREFMVREAGLKGKVGLPELFPGINRWLDHSNPRTNSHASNT